MGNVREERIEAILTKYKVWKARYQILRVNLGLSAEPMKLMPDLFAPMIDLHKESYNNQEKLNILGHCIWSIETAVDALDETEFAIVDRRYFNGHTNQSIWQALYMSKNAYYEHRRHALEKIYDVLQDHLEFLEHNIV